MAIEYSVSRRNDCVSYMQDSIQYHIYKFLNENGLIKEVKETSNAKVVHCPFHTDKTPSMNIYMEQNQFHCYSCGRNGNYAWFRYLYETITLGKDLNYNRFINDILVSDREMQIKLGFETLLETKQFNLSRGLNIKVSKLNKNLPVRVGSFSELATKMKREGLDDINHITLAIIHMQDGHDAEYTYRALTDSLDLLLEPERNLSVDDILGDGF